MNIDRYKSITNLPNEYRLEKIPAHIPEPKDFDYKRGYIARYFVQKSNDITSPVFEISSSTFTNLSNNSFYKTVTLDWRLNGTVEQIKESNFKSVKIAAKQLSAVQLYLPNLLQFYKY
jgi:hypothetical protein